MYRWDPGDEREACDECGARCDPDDIDEHGRCWRCQEEANDRDEQRQERIREERRAK